MERSGKMEAGSARREKSKTERIIKNFYHLFVRKSNENYARYQQLLRLHGARENMKLPLSGPSRRCRRPIEDEYCNFLCSTGGDDRFVASKMESRHISIIISNREKFDSQFVFCGETRMN